MTKVYDKFFDEDGSVPVVLTQSAAENLAADVENMKQTVKQPHAQNKGLMRQQIKAMEAQLEHSAPTPFVGAELDKAVTAEKELAAELSANMLTQAEMRRSPAGAVGKHQAFEKQFHDKICLWKMLRRRLHAGSDDPDVSNAELLRPKSSSRELDMSTTLVETKDYHLPPADADLGVVFSDEDLKTLAGISPLLHSAIALVSNKERAEIKALLAQTASAEVSASTGKPVGRPKGSKNKAKTVKDDE